MMNMTNWLHQLLIENISFDPENNFPGFTRLASIELMYHGTSDVLAPKILSEGLVPGRSLVWDEERSKGDDRSRASYGGIYLTNNFMTAWASAHTAVEQFGGGRLIVIVQVELRTQYILEDEDVLLDPRGPFDRVFNVNANDWFYMQWASNNFYNLDQIVEKYLDELSLDFETGKLKQGFEDPRQREVLKPLVRDFIIAAVMREIAIAMKRERQSQWKSLKYHYPQFEHIELSEAEADYRRAANALMQKTKFLTNYKNRYIHNVRSLEPISFRGTNKIVLVTKIHENKYNPQTRDRGYIEGKYNEDAEILYVTSSQAIQMLIRDLQKSIGGGLRVRYRDKIYLDQPRKK